MTSMAEAARVVDIHGIGSSEREDSRAMLTPANRLAKALCGVAGNSAVGDTLANTLLLAHHPLVCHSAKGAQHLWQGIARRAYGGVEGINRLLQNADIATDVTTSVLDAMQGDISSDRLAFWHDSFSKFIYSKYIPFVWFESADQSCDGRLSIKHSVPNVRVVYNDIVNACSCGLVLTNMYLCRAVQDICPVGGGISGI